MNKKLRDAVYGLAIGDALGVPYEFKSRGRFECKEMVGYGSHGQPEGTWSDDTSMTLATAKSLKDNGGKVVPSDMFANFLDWNDEIDFNCNGVRFDIGGATLSALETGQPQTGEYSNGNGSLMRILPLAFVNEDDYARIDPMDELCLPDVREKIAAGQDELELRNETKGESYRVSLPLTERQRGMILAGGLINYIRKNA